MFLILHLEVYSS